MNTGNSQERQIDALTGIRIIPALLVVIGHFGRDTFPLNISPWHEILTGAGSAVSFFFFLSGFILTHVYAPQVEQGTFRARSFLMARLARIYPVYLLGLLLQAALIGLGIYWDRMALLKYGTEIQPHLVLMQAWLPGWVHQWNAPGWSLSVEAFLYLSFPLLLPWLVRRSPAAWCGLAVGVFALMYLVVEPWRMQVWGPYFNSHTMAREFLLYFPIFHWPTFVLGALSYLGAREIGRRAKPGAPWLTLALGLATAAMCWFMWRAESSRLLSHLVHNGVLAPFYAVIVGAIFLGEPLARRGLSHRSVVLLGEASYSVYILQVPIHGWLGLVAGGWFIRQGAGFYGYVAVLTAVSILVFLLLERPARTHLRRWLMGAPPSPRPGGAA